MKVILIQGEKDAGKTTLCKAIEKWIIDQWTSKHKEIRIVREANGKDDFLGMYEIIDTKGNNKPFKIIINSASDHSTMIKKFETFYKTHRPCDILITAIRPDNASDKKLHEGIKDVFQEDLKKDSKEDSKEVLKDCPFVIDLNKSNGSFSLSDVILEIIKN